MVSLKIWIDISNAPHVRFFKDVIKYFETEGVRVDLPRDGAVLRHTHVVGVVAVVGG